MDTALVAPSRRVDMWFDGTAPQRRLTVGFRLILLIPQGFVLFFLYLAAFIAVIIGWFGALVMGRLPQWVYTFVTGVLRWSTRVSAYGYLLTDQYPPFSFDDESYPARPIMPAPGPLNRWTVLFRWILVIPGAVFVQIVQYGLTFPLLLVAWFIVLISGRMPPALYGPYAALVRYQVRLSAWFSMLTSEYPWGMLGDGIAPAPLAAPPWSVGPAGAPSPSTPAGVPSPGAPASAQPPAWALPPVEADAVSESHEAPSHDVEAETEAAQPWPPPVPPPPPGSVPVPGVGGMPPPSPWERVGPASRPDEGPSRGALVLTGAARGWMIAAIVWGSVLFVTQSAIRAAGNNSSSTVQQFNRTSDDVQAVNRAVIAAASAAGTCTTMSSVAPSQQEAAAKLSRLADDLSTMSLPANATNSARAVESDATQLAAIFQRLGAAPDCTTYRSTARASNFAAILNAYPSDVGQLLSVLHADATS